MAKQRKHRFLVGHQGDDNPVYGKYLTATSPLTLIQAKGKAKRMTDAGMVIFELVELAQIW